MNALKKWFGRKRENPIQEKMQRAAIDIVTDGKHETRIDELRAMLPQLNERIHYKFDPDTGDLEMRSVTYYRRDEEGNFVLDEKGNKMLAGTQPLLGKGYKKTGRLYPLKHKFSPLLRAGKFHA